MDIQLNELSKKELLTEDEMEKILLLDRGGKHDWYWQKITIM